MGDLQKKRKSNCSVPDVESILKEFELKKRKVKVNKNVIKTRPLRRVQSKLNSDGQSKTSFHESNKGDTLSLLITKSCSQTASKTNQQDKKGWQPPSKQHLKTSFEKDMPNSDKFKETYDIDYNMHKDRSTESNDNCHLDYIQSSLKEIIGDSKNNSPKKSNKQTDDKSSQKSFSELELAELNENKACNKCRNAMLQHKIVKCHHQYDDDSLNGKNTLHIENGLTVSSSPSCTHVCDNDSLNNKQIPHLESQKNNSSNLETMCSEVIQINKKRHLDECTKNNVDISERSHDHLGEETQNIHHGINSQKGHEIINIPSNSYNATQRSEQCLHKELQETCLNITLVNKSQTNTAENDTKYEEYDDEEITITHSQLNHIENEFSKKKSSTILTGTQIYSDSMKQSSSLETYASPSFKVLWNKKVEEDGRKLRQIVQELRRINDSLLKIRKEIWPSRNNCSLPKTK